MLDLRDPKFNRVGGNIITLESLIALIKKKDIIPFVGRGMSVDIYGTLVTSLERIMDGYIFGQKAEHIKELITIGRYETAATEIKNCLMRYAF